MHPDVINRIRFAFSIYLLIFTYTLPAQDHNWWAENVEWNGFSHWSEYIISSPEFMGPNAIPIPPIGSGFVDSTHSIGLSSNLHFTEGEHTLNPELYFRFAIIPKNLSFEVVYIPVEYFRTSHRLKTQRRIFYFFYDDRVAQGDIYIHTNLQLFRRPRLAGMFRLGYKIASSSKQGAARFTDAPGYFFDATFKKVFPSVHPFRRYSISLMTGLYVWQTNDDIHFQNDAFLLGVRGGFQFKDLLIEPYIKGFAGFFNNGDRPLVCGLYLHYLIKNIKWTVRWQDGWNDYPFQSLSLGGQFIFQSSNIN